MSKGILNFQLPGKLPAQMVADEVRDLSAAYAADQNQGTPAEKLETFMKMIVLKCVQCRTREDGRLVVNDVADCPEAGCALHGGGPPTFQVIQAKAAYGADSVIREQ